jgi:folate-binding protein YgfZ
MDQEYRTVERGCGWRFRSERGRLRFVGADRVSFLQALITNDMSVLRPGMGTYAAYLPAQGRMIADLHLFDLGDGVVADVPAVIASAIARTFDQLIFSEDVRVTDETSSLRQIQVVGPFAARATATALDLDAASLEQLPLLGQVTAGDGFVARTDDAPGGTWDVFVPAPIEAAVTDALARGGATRLSDALAEALRIDRGRAAWGVDMDETTIPLEAGLLDRAISTTKGCYVGQEVIVRVLHRGGGRVARRLVRLACDPAATKAPDGGTRVYAGDREVGRVTSAAWSPRAQQVIALAYVARDAASSDGALSVDAGDGRIAVEATALVS